MKWLVAFLFLFTIVNAEELTTGNLITNGNFETGNANGWTTSGDVQVLNDCCELNGVTSTKDLEFGDSGYIEQDFNLSSGAVASSVGHDAHNIIVAGLNVEDMQFAVNRIKETQGGIVIVDNQ